jgi:hypothetical protein
MLYTTVADACGDGWIAAGKILPAPSSVLPVYDTARALREIEIKRAHLDQYLTAATACQLASTDEGGSLSTYRAVAWGAVLTDASAWSDHPDYQAKWKL